jgi:hypothetical protein
MLSCSRLLATIPDPWNLPSSALCDAITAFVVTAKPHANGCCRSIGSCGSYQVSFTNGESIALRSRASLGAAKISKNSRPSLAMFPLTGSECIRNAKEGQEHILHINDCYYDYPCLRRLSLHARQHRRCRYADTSFDPLRRQFAQADTLRTQCRSTTSC